MPTLTSNYLLEKPLVNNPIDEDLWGNELNDDLDSIDTLLRAGITFASQSSQTTSFTAAATISVKNLYPCNATGGAFNATIPAAATSANGATVAIKKTDASANAITLLRSASDTLNGATSLTISTQNGSYILVSNGVDAWNSIGGMEIPDASTTVKGIVELATAAEVLAGVDTTRAVTPASLAGNASLSADGYYKFPSGLILQWGSVSQSSSSVSVTFPTAFATACYFAGYMPSAEVGNLSISAKSTTGATLNCGSFPSGTANWFALGV